MQTFLLEFSCSQNIKTNFILILQKDFSVKFISKLAVKVLAKIIKQHNYIFNTSFEFNIYSFFASLPKSIDDLANGLNLLPFIIFHITFIL